MWEVVGSEGWWCKHNKPGIKRDMENPNYAWPAGAYTNVPHSIAVLMCDILNLRDYGKVVCDDGRLG